MKTITGGVCAAKGFYANGIHCGIRKNRTKKRKKREMIPMVLGEKTVNIMQQVMAENKSKPFSEVLEILEI